MAAGGHFENAQLPEFAEAFATPPPKLVNTTYVRTQFHGQSPYKKECMQDSVLEPGLIWLSDHHIFFNNGWDQYSLFTSFPLSHFLCFLIIYKDEQWKQTLWKFEISLHLKKQCFLDFQLFATTTRWMFYSSPYGIFKVITPATFSDSDPFDFFRAPLRLFWTP